MSCLLIMKFWKSKMDLIYLHDKLFLEFDIVIDCMFWEYDIVCITSHHNFLTFYPSTLLQSLFQLISAHKKHNISIVFLCFLHRFDTNYHLIYFAKISKCIILHTFITLRSWFALKDFIKWFKIHFVLKILLW